jgi:hypothetical protein
MPQKTPYWPQKTQNNTEIIFLFRSPRSGFFFCENLCDSVAKIFSVNFWVIQWLNLLPQKTKISSWPQKTPLGREQLGLELAAERLGAERQKNTEGGL